MCRWLIESWIHNVWWSGTTMLKRALRITFATRTSEDATTNRANAKTFYLSTRVICSAPPSTNSILAALPTDSCRLIWVCRWSQLLLRVTDGSVPQAHLYDAHMLWYSPQFNFIYISWTAVASAESTTNLTSSRTHQLNSSADLLADVWTSCRRSTTRWRKAARCRK